MTNIRDIEPIIDGDEKYWPSGTISIMRGYEDPLVTVNAKTGETTFGKDYTPDEAARVFWENLKGPLENARSAGFAEAREMAAKVADADVLQVCPYGNDKPGDPTWNHTDEDICPVCKKNGLDSLHLCVGVPKNRIATAIRALQEPPR